MLPRGQYASDEEFLAALRDEFAGQALANAAICTGTAPEWQLAVWFKGRNGIERHEIVAKQAAVYADAMLAERAKATGGQHD